LYSRIVILQISGDLRVPSAIGGSYRRIAAKEKSRRVYFNGAPSEMNTDFTDFVAAKSLAGSLAERCRSFITRRAISEAGEVAAISHIPGGNFPARPVKSLKLSCRDPPDYAVAGIIAITSRL